MQEHTIQGKNISITDACRLIGTSKDVFAPIKETISNSLDSIKQRETDEGNINIQPEILLQLSFSKKVDLGDKEEIDLKSITVTDNGIGFIKKNLANFKNLASTSKGFNNRGTGFIQVFCRFTTIIIDSNFSEDKTKNRLHLTWKKNGEYSEENLSPVAENKTSVTMENFVGNEKEKEIYLNYLKNPESLETDILKQFLLRLFLNKNNLVLKLSILCNNESVYDKVLDYNSIKPDKTEPIIVNTEQAILTSTKQGKTKIEWKEVQPFYTLNLYRFKIPSNKLLENSIGLYSKDIMVNSFSDFDIIKKNTDFCGYRYISCIAGDLFDKPDSVSHKVDSFTSKTKKEIEHELKNSSSDLLNLENKYVLKDQISDKIKTALSKVYSDVQEFTEEKEQSVITLAKDFGISEEDVKQTKIDLNDTENVIVEKLFQTQAKRLAKESINVRDTYKKIKDLHANSLNPISKEYNEEFKTLVQELLENIPQQNKDELARYIIRRDMVVEILKLALHNELKIQKAWDEGRVEDGTTKKDEEGIIHDLIAKRRTSGQPNDLWILNEEFVHFEHCSDTSLEKLAINGESILKDNINIDFVLKKVGLSISGNVEKWRPDIFVYPEEGKCIIIEFKSPSVELSKYCDQIQKYAQIIASYGKKKFTQFYGFLIGETTGIIPGRYNKAPYGKYWFYPNEPINHIETGEHIADIYQEIIQLSGIGDRAELRNKSFADKLGITEPGSKENKSDTNP